MSSQNPTVDPVSSEATSSSRKSFAQRIDDWLERIADRANPILVKEVRQAMKGRGFVGTFLLLVGVCWIISVLGALNAGAALEYFDWAQTFFCWFFLPLTFAIGMVVPFLAYSSMQNERLDDTFEMLSITTLTARKIVNGKLNNAMMLILLCFSGIAPFIAFTSLLQGFRFTPVLVAMTSASLISIGLCTIAIFVSTLAKRSRMLQALFSLGLIFILLASCSSVQLLFMPEFWTLQMGWGELILFTIFCLILIMTTMLVREMAIAQITFESDNRTSGIRGVVSIIVLVALVGLSTFFFWPSTGGPSPSSIPYYVKLEVVQVVCIASILLTLAVSYFSCTEPPMMSQRVRRQIQQKNSFKTSFLMPWLPGCYRGYIYCLIHLMAAGGLGLVFIYFASTNVTSSPSFFSSRMETFQNLLLVFCLYGFVYSGFGAALSSTLYKKFGKGLSSTAVRAAYLSIIGGLAVIPHLIALIVSEFGRGAPIRYSIAMVTSPLATLLESESGGPELTSAFLILAVVGGLFFFINLKGIAGSFDEARKDPLSIPSRTEDPDDSNSDSMKPEVA